MKANMKAKQKIRNITMISAISMCLFSPLQVQASSYNDAVSDANAAIDKAKSANYEWRDSRKMLKSADKLNKAGKTNEAMKLVAKAQKQGELALAQAELQSSVTGPH